MDDDICDYLNITVTTKSDANNLRGKFAKLEASRVLSPLESLFSSMFHQFVVAKCAYRFKVAQVASDFWRDNVLVFYDKMNVILPVSVWIVFPGLFLPISILFNISLIVVTIAHMKDHKVCNWLIAFESLCQLFVVAPFGANLMAVLFQYDHIDYRICLCVLMASTVASYASILAIYLIFLERLLIVMFPIRMNWSKKSTVRRHSLICVTWCTLFGMIMNLNVFNVWTIINLPYVRWIYCNSGLYSDVLNTVPAYLLLSLCSLNYVAIFGIILWRHFEGKKQEELSGSKYNDQSMRKMLRSVFLLLLVVLVGWLISSAARNQITNFINFITPLVVNCFVSDPTAQTRIQTNISYVVIGIITCLPIWASASAVPILLLNSNDYRIAYRKALKPRNHRNHPIGPLFGN